MRQFCEIGSLSIGDEFKNVNEKNPDIGKIVNITPYTVQFTYGGGHVLFGREKDAVVEIVSTGPLTNEEKIVQLRAALKSIIDGCVHPDTAVRRALIDLAPIKKVLEDTK